jgi:hypothetical protein
MDSLVDSDRCDRCRAQAYVRFTKGLNTLNFCGHHTTEYGDVLDQQGWSISIDERELLTRRAVGAEVS